MIWFLLTVILASSVSSIHHRPSAATPAQIRFAIENKYDDTGPGAKGPEYAYNTFKSLDEALLGYIDDPDTKLPELEKSKAIYLLHKKNNFKYGLEYTTKSMFGGFKPSSNLLHHERKPVFTSYDSRLHDIQKTISDPFGWQRPQSVKINPLSIAHYTREPELEFNPHPKYTYSYGVNDKKTGDLKSAHESRDGGTVHGFYTFVDADGKQRTVQYQADDKLGFRATVQRTFNNKQ